MVCVVHCAAPVRSMQSHGVVQVENPRLCCRMFMFQLDIAAHGAASDVSA